ncbi:MAG: phage holin family protein [Muribaculaceae bacterium]|nr:phage holin family protein [Muribaculaceae bacterium]
MLIRLIFAALAVGITAWLLPGVEIQPWWATVIVAVVLGLINTFIRPVAKFISLPLNILTLGLFTLVINALMVLLCAWCVSDHFKVESFGWALLFSVVLTLVSWFLGIFKK